MSDAIIEMDRESIWKAIKGSGRPVIVEFYSTTCPNCLAVEPVFREIAEELKDEAVFGRLNTEKHTATAYNFGVMGVPTFMTFCSGQPVGAVVGALNGTLLRNDFRDAIKRSAECTAGTTRIDHDLDGYA